MKRFKEISVFGSTLKEYDVPIWNKETKRIVDDSHFIPMSEAVKQLSKTNPLSNGVIEAVYDFPDGHDTGMKPPVARLKPDLAVLSQTVREQNKRHAKDLKKAMEKATDEQFYRDLSKVSSTSRASQSVPSKE